MGERREEQEGGGCWIRRTEASAGNAVCTHVQVTIAACGEVRSRGGDGGSGVCDGDEHGDGAAGEFGCESDGKGVYDCVRHRNAGIENWNS